MDELSAMEPGSGGVKLDQQRKNFNLGSQQLLLTGNLF